MTSRGIPVELKSPAIYDDVSSSLRFASKWTLIEDDDDVTTRLLLQNKLHLHQEWDTPFATGPLKEYIGDYGIGSGAQDILKGNFDPNQECNLPAVNYWIKHHLQRRAPQNWIRVTLSLSEYKELISSQ
eukprot:1659630-Ditylum_brightwellii.AAC.1